MAAGVSRPVTREAVVHLETLFATTITPSPPRSLQRSTVWSKVPGDVATSCAVLATQVVASGR